jgi:murein L,D-transpeptidase YcbB/YkuD
MRDVRTGPKRPVRTFSIFAGAAAFALAATGVPAPARAASDASAPLAVAGAKSVSDFYKSRDKRPLWLSQQGRQAALLIDMLESAELDGLQPDKYRPDALRGAVSAAQSGSTKAVRRADMMLSEAFVDYVRDLRQPADVGTIYVDRELRPSAPSPEAILQAVAKAPSIEGYVAGMRWMNPAYVALRNALSTGEMSEAQRRQVQLNMERARELPAGNGRYIVVNSAAQRLFMYEGGQVVDSMRVVVGKPVYPTPMMAAYVRFANLNPYWYVPPDLAAERIAPNVLKQGVSYLDRLGYQVVSDFIDDPEIFDPSLIDWQAVADGRQKVLIRQQPGAHNSMGRIKFMFPNEQGVYLHDNPDRQLFEEASRLYSGGCVRLESAWRLGRWLFGRDLTWKGAGTEEKVLLDRPVPVYLTYMTAVVEGSDITFLDDVYGRDAARLAKAGNAEALAAAR